MCSVVSEETLDIEIRYMWKKMDKPEVIWSVTLNRAIRGCVLVVDAPYIALMEGFAYNIILQHVPFYRGCIRY